MVDKSILEKYYIEDGLSIRKIAEKLQKSPTSVRKMMKKLNIPRRKNNEHYVDILNKTFGKLYVEKLLEKRCNNRRMWLCFCECGNIIEIDSHKLISGNTKTCGKCKDYNNNSNWKGYGKIGMSYFNSCKRGAKIRNLSFNITIEDMQKKWDEQKGRCNYTLVKIEPPKMTKQEGYIGSLDRKDNSVGYEYNNIQWVIKELNIMKMNMGHERFIHLCSLVNQRNDKSYFF